MIKQSEIKAALPPEGAHDDPLQRKTINASATKVINARCQHPRKETGRGSAELSLRDLKFAYVWKHRVRLGVSTRDGFLNKHTAKPAVSH